MTREKEIEQASVEYQMSKCPKAIGGDAFADMIYKININPSFIAGAEWADKHPFLDEVKETNLNTAVERYVKLHESEFQGYIDLRRIARHFYVLGLNAQKGE